MADAFQGHLLMFLVIYGRESNALNIVKKIFIVKDIWTRLSKSFVLMINVSKREIQ